MPTAETWMPAVAEMVHRDLEGYFDAKSSALRELAPSATLMLDELRALTLRGGKRIRAVLVAAGYRAALAPGDLSETVALGAAMELLQTALLVHDDWMDQDETRRGGPAVHASLRAKLGDRHQGDSVAVLAGDYATSLSLERFWSAPFPAARRDEALQALLAMFEEVYLGQFLDVTGDDDVPRMHRLKTTSYTVLGPLRLGALLGDASRETLDVLERWAHPVGEAFQIRDDLLGTLGTKKATGKPGDDLRHGKRTALLREAQSSASPGLAALLGRVVGDPRAPEEDVAQLIAELEREGVFARVETRVDALIERAQAIVESSALAEPSRSDLRALAEKLGRRSA